LKALAAALFAATSLLVPLRVSWHTESSIEVPLARR
jgi:hypothetical protein